ncbi:hypothetical protein [Elstera cyanobacteriorum]|uniref:Uncharacterized protein n=1 Tax=Elstera cyanobacteriorum TaxID=2022747 RepID=A0A255XZ85_9PROT|nr:hypothetical protein [Elstera cyanobacteriorum]OYQ22252.1 hypothetical protein CHR90_00600 [Elstera cyanobacteriorum]
MIPPGVRATLQHEDRTNQPSGPVSVETMLAKARGEAPSSAAPSAPPAQAPRKITLRFEQNAPALREEEAQRLAGALLVLRMQPSPMTIALGPVGGAKTPGAMALIVQRQNNLRGRMPADLIARTEFRYSPALPPDSAVISAGTGSNE